MDRDGAMAYYKTAPFNLDDAGAGEAADALEATHAAKNQDETQSKFCDCGQPIGGMGDNTCRSVPAPASSSGPRGAACFASVLAALWWA